MLVCASIRCPLPASRHKALYANGHADRLIGSIRRECLDHIVVYGEGHLRPDPQPSHKLLQRAPNASVLGQGFTPPLGDQRFGQVTCRPILGELHH
jgi:hypothetical protein